MRQLRSSIQVARSSEGYMVARALAEGKGRGATEDHHGRRLMETRQAFTQIMPDKWDVASWNMLIGAYTNSGHHEEAFKVFRQMQQEKVKPNSISFVSILKACERPLAFAAGKLLHSHILSNSMASHVIVGTALLTMYTKCGSIRHAYKVFRSLIHRDVISWNAIIAGYALSGYGMETMKLYLHMQREAVAPNKITFINILKACDNAAALVLGKLLHAHIVHLGIDSDGMVTTAVIDMYCKCGIIDQACVLFDRMPERDTVSWNTMIVGCQQLGHGDLAVKLFWRMQKEGMSPNDVTFISILKVCASLGSRTDGKLVHAKIADSGMEGNPSVGNALVDMYSKCGSIDDAHCIFETLPEQTVFSWSVIISAYVQHGLAKEAMELFKDMQCKSVKPDKFTFSSVVTACASLESLALAKAVHAQIINSGCELDTIMGNALVNMFVKCSSIKDAHDVFDKMLYRDVASWTALVTGYAQHGYFEEAFILFQEMQRQGVKPNDITFISWLMACASQAALREGKLVHAHIVNSGMQLHLELENALIDMYGKCGSIECARSLFERMHTRDIVSWTVMITGCAHQSCTMEAFELFKQMKQDNVKPDNFIFSSILAACNHAGLIDEGSYCFKFMIQEHGILPMMEHYAGMIDLFGRAGNLDDAESFINQMPCQPSLAMWVSFLSACRSYGNVVLAEHIINYILETQDQNAAMYTLLAKMYATTGRWNDEAKVRKLRKE